MNPRLMRDNLVHSHRRHAKPICERLERKFTSNPKTPRFNHLSLGEPMCANFFSTKLATLFNLVLHVLGAISKPKMVWIYTCRIIPRWAVVKNAESIGDWASIQNPRSTGSDYGLSDTSIDVSISSLVGASSPQPALSRFINFRLKTIWEVIRKSLRRQVFGGNLDMHSLNCADWVTGPTALLLF